MSRLNEFIEAAEMDKAKVPTRSKEEALYYKAHYLSTDHVGNPLDYYKRLQVEQANGEGELSHEVDQSIERDYSAANRQVALDILGTDRMTPAQKAVLLDNLKSPEATLKDAYVDQQISQPNGDEEQTVAHMEDMGEFQERQKEEQAILMYYESLAADTFKEDPWGTVTGYLGMMVPYIEPAHINTFASKLKDTTHWKGTDWKLTDALLLGTLKEDLAKYFLALPLEHRNDAARELWEVVLDTPGIDVVKRDLIDQVLYGQRAGWEEAVENITSIGEWASVFKVFTKPLALSAKGIINAVSPKPSPSSPIATTMATNPTEAAKIAAAALTDDTDKVAKAAGATKEEIAGATLFPSPNANIVSDAPSNVKEVLLKIRGVETGLNELTNMRGMLVNEGEKAAQIVAAEKAIVKNSELKVSVNNSTIVDTGNGYKITGTMMDGEHKPFSSFTTATKAASALHPDEFTIIKKVGDEWKEVAKPAGRGKYAVRINQTSTYNHLAVDGFGSDAVVKGGMLGRAALDPASRIAPAITAAAERAADITSLFEQSLIKPLKGAFDKLSTTSIKRVDNVIVNATDDLTRLGKNEYDYQDLVDLKLDDDEIAAVMAFQDTNRVIYNFDNKLYTEGMTSQGYQWIVDKATKGGGRVYGKPVELEKVDVEHFVTNVTNNATTVMSKADLKKLYDNGGSIVRLERPVHKGNDVYEYMVVDGLGNKLAPIPKTGAMPFIPGYYKRNYNEYYKVVETAKNGKINGKAAPNKVSRTVAMFGSRLEAEDWAAKNGKKGYTYEYPPLRELTVANEFMEDGLRVGDISSLRMSRSRGEHLKGTGEGNLANVDGPTDAIFDSIRAAGQRVGTTDFINSTKQRMLNSFSKLADENGNFPTEITPDMLRHYSSVEQNTIINMMDYINTIERMPPKYKKTWNRGVLSLAEKLDKSLPGVARAARDLFIGRDPASVAKATSYLRYIRLRPFRQVLLQSSNLLQYAAFEPLLFAKGKLGLDVWNILTKQKGNALADMFAKSGLRESIQQHPHITRLPDSRYKSGILRKFSGAFKTMNEHLLNKTVDKGFEYGELTNLAGAFSVAARRYERKHGAIDPNNVHALNIISSDARGLAMSMNQAGRMSYQTLHNTDAVTGGLISMTTQFASAPHKALLQSTFNRRFSWSEKAALAAWNIGLFGEYAFSLGRIVENVNDWSGLDILPEEESEWYQKHKAGILNYALREWLMQEAGIDLAKAISPTEGSMFIIEVLDKLGEQPFYDVAFGASGHTVKALGNILDTLKAAFNVDDTMPTQDVVLKSLNAVANFASGWSDAEKAWYAHRNGVFVDSNYNETVAASAGEAFAKVFGIGSEAETALHNYTSRRYNKRKENRKIAKRIVRRLNYLYEKDPVNFKRTAAFEKLQHRWLPADHRREIYDEVRKELMRGTKTKEYTMYSTIANDIMKGYNVHPELNDMVPDEHTEARRKAVRVLTGEHK